ncbi:hypothetical protein [Streptomyces sp. NPDC050528]|uniref:hypothetical protein n=1 Tax=unclassified Streptomyces TaxID=2593676 RepID=UPI003790253F
MDRTDRASRYGSDRSESEWQVIRPLLPVPGWSRARVAGRRGTGVVPVTLRQPADDGDWLPAALVGALRKTGWDPFGRPGLGGLLGGPDPSDALHRWTEFRLAAPDAAARAPRLAAADRAGPAHTTARFDDLAAVGVTPTPARPRSPHWPARSRSATSA